jgi:hypothetical protein
VSLDSARQLSFDRSFEGGDLMVFLQDGLGFFDWFVGAIVFLVGLGLFVLFLCWLFRFMGKDRRRKTE